MKSISNENRSQIIDCQKFNIDNLIDSWSTLSCFQGLSYFQPNFENWKGYFFKISTISIPPPLDFSTLSSTELWKNRSNLSYKWSIFRLDFNRKKIDIVLQFWFYMILFSKKETNSCVWEWEHKWFFNSYRVATLVPICWILLSQSFSKTAKLFARIFSRVIKICFW